MSLDLQVGKRDKFDNSFNITHNLWRMAKAVRVQGTTLYDCLWLAEDNNYTSNDLFDGLLYAYQKLMRNRRYYMRYNPVNGWGDVDGLTKFVGKVLLYCLAHPGEKIYCDR